MFCETFQGLHDITLLWTLCPIPCIWQPVMRYHMICLVFVVISSFLHMGLCKWCRRRNFVLRKIWVWVLPLFIYEFYNQGPCLIASLGLISSPTNGVVKCATLGSSDDEVTDEKNLAYCLAQSGCSKMLFSNNVCALEGDFKILWKLQKIKKTW